MKLAINRLERCPNFVTFQCFDDRYVRDVGLVHALLDIAMFEQLFGHPVAGKLGDSDLGHIAKGIQSWAFRLS